MNFYLSKILYLFFIQEIISFKAGSDDLRNSPSQKLVDLLNATGAIVKVHDPFVKDTLSLNKVLEDIEIIIIATNHNEFKKLENVIENKKIKVIYDVWGMYKKENLPSLKYLRLGMN